MLETDRCVSCRLTPVIKRGGQVSGYAGSPEVEFFPPVVRSWKGVVLVAPHAVSRGPSIAGEPALFVGGLVGLDLPAGHASSVKHPPNGVVDLSLLLWLPDQVVSLRHVRLRVRPWLLEPRRWQRGRGMRNEIGEHGLQHPHLHVLPLMAGLPRLSVHLWSVVPGTGTFLPPGPEAVQRCSGPDETVSMQGPGGFASRQPTRQRAEIDSRGLRSEDRQDPWG
jgi:hypothetical protein